MAPLHPAPITAVSNLKIIQVKDIIMHIGSVPKLLRTPFPPHIFFLLKRIIFLKSGGGRGIEIVVINTKDKCKTSLKIVESKRVWKREKNKMVTDRPTDMICNMA